MTPCAAKWTACCEEPHCRSTVVAGTSSGNPAASHAFRPMLMDCSPICETQPVMLSSISPGSTPARSTNVRVRVDEVDSDFPVTVPERSRAFAERSRYLSETSPVPAFHVDPLPAVSGSLNRPFTLPLTVNVAEPVRRFTTAEGGGEVG